MNDKKEVHDARSGDDADRPTTRSAAEPRDSVDGEDEGVLTLVCFKCGTEYYFRDGEPPEEMSCEKCRNTVFRSYYSPLDENEAIDDFRDSTERDLDTDDPEGDTKPGDVLDLRR